MASSGSSSSSLWMRVSSAMLSSLLRMTSPLMLLNSTATCLTCDTCGTKPLMLKTSKVQQPVKATQSTATARPPRQALPITRVLLLSASSAKKTPAKPPRIMKTVMMPAWALLMYCPPSTSMQNRAMKPTATAAQAPMTYLKTTRTPA